MAADLRITFEQEAQYRSWVKDPIVFMKQAVKIEGKVPKLDDAGEPVLDRTGKPKMVTKVIPFAVRSYQEDCITRFLSTQICAVLKARQIGLTTAACALALWLLLFQPNRFILVLSKNDKDAKKFMRRIKFMYERLPPWVKARAPQLVGRWGVEEAEFDNGSIIFSATSSSDHGRGDTPTDVFLDEVGKMRNQEDSWSALIPATEAGGNLWMFGTADGFKDWFHRMWEGWVQDPDIDTIFYGWDVVEGRDESWAQKMRRKLGDALFRREYPSTAEEAFVNSGSNVFSIDVLLEIEAAPPRRCKLTRDSGSYRLVDELTHTDEFGFFVYEAPIPGAKYLVAADPAEGLVKSDPSALQILRWGQGEGIFQVAVVKGLIEPNDLGEQIHHIAAFYNRAHVAVERNNHGGTVLQKLRRLRTPNVIRGGANRPGLWTGPGSKATNIAVTRRALADEHLVLRDQQTIDELMGFQERQTAAGNSVYEGTEHDDLVDALCIGVGYAVKNAPYDEEPVDETPPDEPPHPFSFDGLMARRLIGATRII